MTPQPEADRASVFESLRTPGTSLNLAGSSVRYVMDDGVPWLCAIDFCGALGLKLSSRNGPGPCLRRLDPSVRGYLKVPTRSGVQRMAVVSVDGAIAMTHQRKRPVDKRLRSALKRDVLPLKVPTAAELNKPLHPFSKAFWEQLAQASAIAAQATERSAS